MVDYVGLARDAYTSSTTFFDAGIRAQIEADLRQFNSQHPSNSKYLSDSYRARSKFFRPKTRSAIRKNEAIAAEAFFSSDDVVSITPQNDDDPEQKGSAEIYKYLMQYRLTKTIPWFLTVIGAYQDAQSVGVVASYNYWKVDPRKRIDEPCIDLVPVENLRIDPAADWRDPINTSPYVIHLLPMYVKDVKAKAGREWKPVTETQILQATRTQGDPIRLTRESPRPDRTEQGGAITNFTIVWVHRNVMEIDGQDMVWHTLGTEALLDDPVLLSAAYFHGKRPYTMGCCVIETHKLYPSSLPRMTKDTQGELNTNANLRIDNVNFAMNKRYFIKRNEQVDTRSLQRNAPGSITMMNNPETDVKIVETGDVTGSAYAEQDRLNLDFDDLVGTFSNSSVQSNRRLNETVGGMNILTTNANQVSGYQLRTFVETWVEPTLRQLQLLEAEYETDETILALAGQAAAPILEKFGVNPTMDALLAHEMTINVNVGMGATNPHQQVDNFLSGMKALKEILADGVLERYGLSIEEVTKEIFSKLGYRTGNRFFDWNNEEPQVVALKQQLTQLQSALDAKYPPEMLAAQVAKLSAEAKSVDAKTLETIVRAVYASMQSGEVIAAVPQVAPIADAVMQIGGYQRPQPAGIDPNFPALAGVGALAVQAVKDKRTGIAFTPGAAGDTSPETPALPATPGVGAEGGINTLRADG